MRFARLSYPAWQAQARNFRLVESLVYRMRSFGICLPSSSRFVTLRSPSRDDFPVRNGKPRPQRVHLMTQRLFCRAARQVCLPVLSLLLYLTWPGCGGSPDNEPRGEVDAGRNEGGSGLVGASGGSTGNAGAGAEAGGGSALGGSAGSDAGAGGTPAVAGLPATGRWTCEQMTAHFNSSLPDKAIDAVCIEKVDSREAWLRVSVPEAAMGLVASTKYFFPWQGRTQIPHSFIHATNLGPAKGNGDFETPLHLFFAHLFLGPYFPSGTYQDLYFATGSARVVNGGALGEWLRPDGSREYAYVLYGSEKLSCDEQKAFHTDILSAFTLRPLRRLVSERFIGAQAPPAGCSIPLLAE